MSCRISPLRASKNHAPARGIEDAILRACSSNKNEIVGSRGSVNSLKNDISKQKRLMSCRILLSRFSQNPAPAWVIFYHRQ
ncbi:hypothetical protein [Ignatzschineria cameli]|uniref:hypothetical protein n=1 Tax=Ignatzschineria cameli TaxID=2182793 RepID=UPI00105809C9|nr:hypothetical protein [Ignatzschineria cameli]